MKIIILDPFYEYSHKQWAEGLKKYSSHDIEILSLSAHHWKWKMVGGAIDLAERFNQLNGTPDLILATDMLDLNTFLSLIKIDKTKTSISLFFHENQITYPWQNANNPIAKERNHHYGFINFRSCISADHIYFNSYYHLRSFIDSLPAFLKMFPGFKPSKYITEIKEKSIVLPLGLELPETTENNPSETPVFLWNHRWEHDKNPDVFFKTLFKLKERGTSFELIVLGKSYGQIPPIFEEARAYLKEEIIRWGFVESKSEYKDLLKKANLLLVTSQQDFFGISAVEAISHGVYPVLPKRLAFPEHIPQDLHQDVLYESDDELISKLEEIISKKKFTNMSRLQQNVQKYNWNELIYQYDDTFTNSLTYKKAVL